MSRWSNDSTTIKRENWESRNLKTLSEAKFSRNVPNTQELLINNEFFDHHMASVEPKDVSDRTLSAFEGYLSYVNSMYFEFSGNQPHQTLNQVSSLLSNSQKRVQMETEPRSVGNQNKQEGDMDDMSSNDFHYMTLDVLANPLRVPHVFENWSPREIAIFESWIWKFGKCFHLFPPFIKSKTRREVVEFYSSWKNTSHFKVWSQKMESLPDSAL